MTIAAMTGQRFDMSSVGSNRSFGDVLKVDFFDGAKTIRQSGAAMAGARTAATVAGETLASGALRIGGTILTANAILQGLQSAAERSQVHSAIERFNLDPKNARDVLAARAYVWGRNMAPNAYWSVPYSGPVNERVATALLRLERLAPTTLGRATLGDTVARARIDAVVSAAVSGSIDTPTMRSMAGVEAETETRARPIPIAARALDTNNDGRLQCREIGRWAPDPGYAGYSANARAYQDYVSGRPGQHFVVTDVQRSSGVTAFDSCRDTPVGAHLSEAKADHGVVLSAPWGARAREGIGEQGVAQQRAARTLGVTNDLQAQSRTDRDIIAGVYRSNGVTTPVLHNPNAR